MDDQHPPHSPPSLRVRAARDSDVPGIQRIYACYVLEGTASFEEAPPDDAEIARRMSSVYALGMPYLVGEVDGRLAGYAYAGSYRPRSAYRFTVENSVYVDPQFLRCGVGSALLGELIVQSARSGARQMIAVIGDSANQASIALHRRHGFRMVGTFTNVGFKFNRWLDSVLMQLELADENPA